MVRWRGGGISKYHYSTIGGRGTNLGSNDVIDHVLNCASGALPQRTGTSTSVTVGVTTWLDEDSQSPSYSSVFAPGLKSSVPMGLDTYFFSCCGSGTNIASWQNPIAWAVGYSHATFVEEFAMPRRIVSESMSGERQVLLFPRLERVAPDLVLPRVEIKWTKRELECLAGLASATDARGPTDALVRAMRD